VQLCSRVQADCKALEAASAQLHARKIKVEAQEKEVCKLIEIRRSAKPGIEIEQTFQNAKNKLLDMLQALHAEKERLHIPALLQRINHATDPKRLKEAAQKAFRTHSIGNVRRAIQERAWGIETMIRLARQTPLEHDEHLTQRQACERVAQQLHKDIRLCRIVDFGNRMHMLHKVNAQKQADEQKVLEDFKVFYCIWRNGIWRNDIDQDVGKQRTKMIIQKLARMQFFIDRATIAREGIRVKEMLIHRFDPTVQQMVNDMLAIIHAKQTEAAQAEDTTASTAEDTTASSAAKAQAEDTTASSAAKAQAEDTAASTAAKAQAEDTAASSAEDTTASSAAKAQAEDTTASSAAKAQAEDTAASTAAEAQAEDTAASTAAEAQAEDTAAKPALAAKKERAIGSKQKRAASALGQTEAHVAAHKKARKMLLKEETTGGKL